MSVRLERRPISLREANAFIKAKHRHHDPDRGHKFSIAVYLGDDLVGVAITGRPKARLTNYHIIAEVTRCCTDGAKNACSLLYSACARAAEAMGYREIQTFILASETGHSLRASGWEEVAMSDGDKWDRPSRTRERKPRTEGPKRKFRKLLNR